MACSTNNTACDLHGDNLIDSYSGVKTISECRHLCYNTESCEFITYYGGRAERVSLDRRVWKVGLTGSKVGWLSPDTWWSGGSKHDQMYAWRINHDRMYINEW